MATKSKRKATQDARGNDLYLAITEDRSGGYFHLRARVATQKYEQGGSSCGGSWQVEGVDDDYADGLLWSGLRASCQGDEQSRLHTDREPVYGYGVGYPEPYYVDLRKARRMLTTLETIDKGLRKLDATRGTVRTYGAYLGRLAEVLGCAGIAIERSERGQRMSGSRWDWLSVGDGVDRVTHLVYRWQQEGIEAAAPRQPRQLQGEVVEG